MDKHTITVEFHDNRYCEDRMIAIKTANDKMIIMKKNITTPKIWRETIEAFDLIERDD